MSDVRWLVWIGCALGGLGLWCSLPPRGASSRALGGVLGFSGLGFLGAALPGLADGVSQVVFWILASVTILAAAAAVTFRNPVYCAIWFGLALAGTAGLFLFQGAQFLAVATVVVYAGAILVTFLFILMLAQPSGRARYDRVSVEALVSAASGAILVGVLATTVLSVLASSDARQHALQVPPHERQQAILAEDHVRQIGVHLFTTYLVPVQLVGVLLFVALVGAAVIGARGNRAPENLSAPSGGWTVQKSEEVATPPLGRNHG